MRWLAVEWTYIIVLGGMAEDEEGDEDTDIVKEGGTHHLEEADTRSQ